MRTNEYIIKDDHAILRIHSKKHGTIDCKVDLDKVEDLKQWNWYAVFKPNIKNFYINRAVRESDRRLYRAKELAMHQYLLWSQYQSEASKTVDHGIKLRKLRCFSSERN